MCHLKFNSLYFVIKISKEHEANSSRALLLSIGEINVIPVAFQIISIVDILVHIGIVGLHIISGKLIIAFCYHNYKNSITKLA